MGTGVRRDDVVLWAAGPVSPRFYLPRCVRQYRTLRWGGHATGLYRDGWAISLVSYCRVSGGAWAPYSNGYLNMDNISGGYYFDEITWVGYYLTLLCYLTTWLFMIAKQSGLI